MPDASSQVTANLLAWKVTTAFACAVAVVAVAIACAALHRAESDQARRLDIVDSAGRTRIRLTADKSGPRIDLLDEKGAPSMVLHAGHSLGKADPPVDLFTTERGEPVLALRSPQGKHQLELSVRTLGDVGPSLLMSSPGSWASLGTARIGPALRLMAGERTASLQLSKDEDPTLTLKDPSVVAELVLSRAIAMLQVISKHGHPLLDLSASPSGGELSLLGKTVVQRSPAAPKSDEPQRHGP